MGIVNLNLYKKVKVDDSNVCENCVFEAFDEDHEGICTLGAATPKEIGCIDKLNGYIFVSIPEILKKL